jgi:cytochrome c-type biogenesis protein
MDVTGLVAFSAGILSFFSPCVLPLVPSFLIYISGASITQYSDLSDKKYRKTILLHSIFFIAGFSLVFVCLGYSSSFLGNIFSEYQTWITRIGGVFLVIMGFNMLNLLKIPFLNQEKLIHIQQKKTGFLGSFIIGVTFSLGWTPCIGPVLSTILLLSATSGATSKGVYLLGLYSLGMAIPFFAASLLVARLMDFMRRWGHIVRYSSYVLGAFLISIGALLLSGYYTFVTRLLG